MFEISFVMARVTPAIKGANIADVPLSVDVREYKVSFILFSTSCSSLR